MKYTAIVTTPSGARNVKDVEAPDAVQAADKAAQSCWKPCTIIIVEDPDVRGLRNFAGNVHAWRTASLRGSPAASIGKPFPIARNTDPETSQAAAAKIEGKLSERRRQTLELVKANPDKTSGELGLLFLEKHRRLGSRVCILTPHRRLGELERLHYVTRGEPRKCTDTGYLCATWRATDKKEPEK